MRRAFFGDMHGVYIYQTSVGVSFGRDRFVLVKVAQSAGHLSARLASNCFVDRIKNK